MLKGCLLSVDYCTHQGSTVRFCTHRAWTNSWPTKTPLLDQKKKIDPAGRGVRFFQASHSNTSKANEFVKQSMVNVSFLSQHSSHCVQQVKRITSCLPHCYGMHAQPALKQMLQKQIYVRCKKQGWRCKHEEKGQHMNTSEPRQVCFSAVTT